MPFLKKLGNIIVKGLQLAAQFEGLVTAVNPKTGAIVHTVSTDLAQIANIITQVEAIGQALDLPGAQKLTASAPGVAQVILQSSILVNHKVENAVLFQQGCQKIADGMADVLNSLKDDVESVDKSASGAGR